MRGRLPVLRDATDTLVFEARRFTVAVEYHYKAYNAYVQARRVEQSLIRAGGKTTENEIEQARNTVRDTYRGLEKATKELNERWANLRETRRSYQQRRLI